MDYMFLPRFTYIYFASVSYVFAVIMFIVVGLFFKMMNIFENLWKVIYTSSQQNKHMFIYQKLYV